MRILDRHIGTHVLGFSLMVGFALVALQSFISFAAESDQLAEDFGLWQLLLVVALETPTFLLLLLPMIALIGTLLGLGALAQQGELVAMRAAGVSILRIGGATLFAGIALAALALLLTDVVAPAGERAAEQLKSEARFGTDPGAAIRPVWLRDGDAIYHIRRIETPTRLGAITVYVLSDDRGLSSIAEVDSARFEEGQWLASDIALTVFEEDGVRMDAVDSLHWDSGPAPDVLELVLLESDALSIRGLWRLIGYLERNGLDTREYELELWRKVMSPLTVLVMMLLAVPFVLGSLRDSGSGQRLLVGVLVGVAFWVGNEMVGASALIYGWPPALAAVLPSIVILVIALWRLQRTRA